MSSHCLPEHSIHRLFNKACTVYGAGCETDESKGIYSTNVGEITIQHGTEVNGEGETVNKTNDLDGIHIEGIVFTESVNICDYYRIVTLKDFTLKTLQIQYIICNERFMASF